MIPARPPPRPMPRRAPQSASKPSTGATLALLMLPVAVALYVARLWRTT